MKLNKLSILLLQVACLIPLQAHADSHTHPARLEGFIHRTAPSTCLSKEKAEAEARELAVKSAKNYCRSEGYGWRAATVKDLGNLDCHSCGGGNVKCDYAGVSLECRKAEPQLSLLGWFVAQR